MTDKTMTDLVERVQVINSLYVRYSEMSVKTAQGQVGVWNQKIYDQMAAQLIETWPSLSTTLEAQAREIAEWKAAADTEARMKRYAEANLSTVRRDALEEAAKIANEAKHGPSPGPLYSAGFLDAASFIARSILSLQSTPVHAGEVGFTNTDKQTAVPCATDTVPEGRS